MLDRLTVDIFNIQDKSQHYRYDDFKGYNIEISRDSLASAFSIIINKRTDHIQLGDFIKAAINGRDILWGIIEKLEERYDKGTHDITLSGRDLTCFLVDDYFSPASNMLYDLPKSPSDSVGIVLDQIIKESSYSRNFQRLYIGAVFKSIPAGYYIHSSIYKIDFNISMKINPGDKIWDRILEICKVFAIRVLFRSDLRYIEFIPANELSHDKNFKELITGFNRGDFEGLTNNKYKIICKRNAVGNNVISGNFTQDITERYSNTWATGENNLLTISGAKEYIDPTLRVTKTKVVKYNGNNLDLDFVAKDDVNIQRIKGCTIKYTVSGHTQNSVVYDSTSLAVVNDEMLGINDTFAIRTITYKFSLDTGVTTELGLSPLRSDEVPYNDPRLIKTYGDSSFVAGQSIEGAGGVPDESGNENAPVTEDQ